MAGNIDFGNVDKAFQHLADTPEGNKALSGLAAALDHIGATVKPKLNNHELHFLVTNLVQQRQGAFGPGVLGEGATRGGARVKSGFLIKTAVPA